MKHILLILLTLFAVVSMMTAQSSAVYPGNFVYDDAQLLTFSHNTGAGYITNYTSTSDDSTAYITLSTGSLGTRVGLCREVYLVLVSTDSLATDLTVRMRNASLTSLTTTYTDSMIATSNTLNYKVIVLKDAATNRLTAYDEIKLIADIRASGTGTTTGRTFKAYLAWVR
jgi:hypothetical protein